MDDAEPRPRVVLGVSGGIAAYKTATLLRLLTESGHGVQVVPTKAALKFVGAATWAALSGQPVLTKKFGKVHEVPHVRLGQTADLVVVAPATADVMAKIAHGQADDLLTLTVLTARCPVLLAPAMHTEMWLNPATQANVSLLRERGIVVLEPASGRLTGSDTGPGRMPEPEAIFAAARSLLRQARDPDGDGPTFADLGGLRVVISAGGTREPLDPVRYLGNRSSGLQGHALATVAAARGATVTLVTTSPLPDPAGVEVVRVETALELREAVKVACAGAPGQSPADVVVMAAAVADFRPAEVADHKLKKNPKADDAPLVRLIRNPDILAELVGEKAAKTIVGFAAETGDEQADVLTHARAKLAHKGCDLLVVNDVSAGKVFGRNETEVVVLDSTGQQHPVPAGTKDDVADAIWNIIRRWRNRPMPESGE